MQSKRRLTIVFATFDPAALGISQLTDLKTANGNANTKARPRTPESPDRADGTPEQFCRRLTMTEHSADQLADLDSPPPLQPSAAVDEWMQSEALEFGESGREKTLNQTMNKVATALDHVSKIIARALTAFGGDLRQVPRKPALFVVVANLTPPPPCDSSSMTISGIIAIICCGLPQSRATTTRHVE